MDNKLVAQPFKRFGQESRCRTLETQPFAGHRMVEPEQAGMEQDAIEGPEPLPRFRGQRGQPAGPVEAVSEERMAEARKMDADLMGAAGFQYHFEARRAGAGRLRHPIAGHRPLAALDHRHALSVVAVAADRAIDHPFHLRR